MVRCESCEEEREGKWKCSGCNSKVVYCSKSCQNSDWPIHIFDCYAYRGKKVPTAYHLSRACFRDLMPIDEQTLEDYGFNKAITPIDHMMLLGLYQGLFKYFEITPKTVQTWKREGKLIQEIKKTFEEIPPQNRGQYYPWFLEHQDLLGPSHEPSKKVLEARAYVLESHMRAWRYIGGRPLPNSSDFSTVMSDFKIETATWPQHKRDCFDLCRLALSEARPSPSQPIWLSFGFCTTQDQYHEMRLGSAYRTLVTRCSFEELCQAYDSCSLLQLFSSKNISLDLFGSQLADFLADTSRGHKSVWDLKQFVLDERDDPDIDPIASVAVDYGFCNCRNEEEKAQLKEVYKMVFVDLNGDPLKLHEACVQGKIYDYVTTTLKLPVKKKDQRPLIRRLMKNPYPLLVLDGSD